MGSKGQIIQPSSAALPGASAAGGTEEQLILEPVLQKWNADVVDIILAHCSLKINSDDRRMTDSSL